jgi:hypothetical protein
LPNLRDAAGRGIVAPTCVPTSRPPLRNARKRRSTADLRKSGNLGFCLRMPCGQPKSGRPDKEQGQLWSNKPCGEPNDVPEPEVPQVCVPIFQPSGAPQPAIPTRHADTQEEFQDRPRSPQDGNNKNRSEKPPHKVHLVFGGLTTALMALSVAFFVMSPSAFHAASGKPLDCSGSSWSCPPSANDNRFAFGRFSPSSGFPAP